jgi:phosphoesterase RecJ-like protein
LTAAEEAAAAARGDADVEAAERDRLAPVVACLARARGVVIATHRKPDGDAVGACLGLKRMLQARGKPCWVVDLEPLPPRYAGFLRPGEASASADVPPDAADLLAVLDCAEPDRMPETVRKAFARLPILNIDHHPNSGYGAVNLVDTGASCAGELVYRVALAAAYAVERDAAEALWVALVTDTGRFSHDNTTPRALRTAAALLATGLRPRELERRLFQSMPPKVFSLRAAAMRGTVFSDEGRLAAVSLGHDDFRAAGCGPEHAEDIVELPRGVRGVEAVVFFYETDTTGDVKVSVRAEEPHDAAALCRRYGGGGHVRAAGCTLKGTLDDVREAFLAAARAAWFGISP